MTCRCGSTDLDSVHFGAGGRDGRVWLCRACWHSWLTEDKP